MTKVYLAHSISTKGEKRDSIRVANRIRKLGYEVYAAAENNAINDKSNEPSVIDIYNGDVTEIMSCDVFVVNISGGNQDGTISEVGMVAGINEILLDLSGGVIEGSSYAKIPIVGYTSNERLLQPQHHHGIPSGGANHLVLGMIERWGKFVGTEDIMVQEMRESIK